VNNVRAKKAALVGMSAVMLTLFGMAGIAPAHANEDNSSLANLSAESVDLYASDTPKIIRIDPGTGQVLSVSPDSAAAARSVVQGCSGDVACWFGRPPALNFGFNGSGGSGAWANRGSFQTRNYTALVCWSYGTPPISVTHCTPSDERAGKNSTIEWGSAVTGVSVSLSR
jgi:hypothetical protein